MSNATVNAIMAIVFIITGYGFHLEVQEEKAKIIKSPKIEMVDQQKQK